MVYREPLTVGQASRVCNVCRRTVLNWINAGALKAFTTHGGHYRIWPANLRKFLDESGMDIPFVSLDVRSTHVLIIDDNSSFSKMLGHLMTEEFPGIEVSITESVPQGLVLIGELQPRLLILNLDLPELTGLEILTLMRSRKERHPMHVMGLSACLDAETKRQALTLGADCAMNKVSDINLILQAIAGLTGRARHVMVEV